MVVLAAIPALALLPAILDGGDDDNDQNSSTSTSSPPAGSSGVDLNTPTVLPTTEQPVDGFPSAVPSPSPVTPGEGISPTVVLPTTEQPVDGFPNTPPLSTSPGSSGEGIDTPPLLPTVDGPILLPDVTEGGTITIPEPRSILGPVAAGAGLLVLKFKKRSKR